MGKSLWYEGNVADPGIDALTFVVKPKNPAFPLQPFVILEHILPLCFAHDQDYNTAVKSDTHFLKLDHPQLTEYARSMRPADDSKCTPFCQLDVPKSGFNCPSEVSLGQDVFVSKTSDGKSADFNQYVQGTVSAIFFDNEIDLSLSYKVTYNIEEKGTITQKTFNAKAWGPSPPSPTGSSSFIIPVKPATAPKVAPSDASPLDSTSFGQWIIAQNPTTSTAELPVFNGGVIKNIVGCKSIT